MSIYKTCGWCKKKIKKDQMLRVFVINKGKGRERFFCCKEHGINAVGKEYF